MDPSRRTSILEEARSFLGTPYHHKGRVKGVGVDCGGFLYEVYRKFYDLKPFPENYAMDWALHRSDELYLNWICEYVKEIGTPSAAGIVLFRYGRCFGHGGIVSDNRTVIHAWGQQDNGKVRESPFIFFNSGRVVRPRRYFSIKDM